MMRSILGEKLIVILGESKLIMNKSIVDSHGDHKSWIDKNITTAI